MWLIHNTKVFALETFNDKTATNFSLVGIGKETATFYGLLKLSFLWCISAFAKSTIFILSNAEFRIFAF